MNDERILSVAVPGDWSDGWLYKDSLFLCTQTGALLQSPVADIVAQLRRSYGEDVALAAQLSLFRNDWKGGLQTSAFARSAHMVKGFRTVADEALRAGALTIDTSSFEPVDIVPGFILSVSIYGNHAFIASSEGLFETNVNPRYINLHHEVVRRLDMPVHAIETNYGAVAVSAFEGGLWFDQIDFDGEASWLSPRPLERMADYSRGVAMAAHDLLNTTEATIPDLYVGDMDYGFHSPGARFPSWRVRGFSRSSEALATVTARRFGLNELELGASDIRLIGNSHQRLLYSIDGSLQVLRLKTLDGIRLERLRGYDARVEEIAAGGTPSSAVPLGSGFLLEFDDHTVWLGSNGVTEVTRSAAVTVRTFPNARHFNETGLVVEDHRLILFGILDFPRK